MFSSSLATSVPSVPRQAIPRKPISWGRSPTVAITIGIVVVARLAARAAPLATVTITSGPSRTSLNKKAATALWRGEPIIPKHDPPGSYPNAMGASPVPRGLDPGQASGSLTLINALAEQGI